MKEKILRETFKLLLKKGFDGTSITDIQNAIGMSRTLVYHYFKNKDELLLAACKTYFFLRYSAMPKNADSMTCLQHIEHTISAVRNISLELSDDGKSSAPSMENYNILFYQSIRRYPEIRKYMQDYYQIFIDVLKNAIKRGEVKCDLPPEIIGKYFLYIFDGVINYSVDPPDCEHMFETLRRELMAFYNIIKAQ